jgi:AcrR family transcriptional regulator
VDKPRKKRVRKNKAVRRREIAEATLRLVAKYGLDGATVSRIAAAVGLSRGALYRHFANREAVLLAAMDLMGERAAGWIALAARPRAYDHLVALVDIHADWAEAELETFIRPVFQFVAGAQQRHLTEEMAERQLRVFEKFVAIVDAAKQEGSIKPDVPSEDVAWSLLMFAWAEDYARFEGVDQFITGGSSRRNLKRLLESFKVEEHGTKEPARPT